MEKAFSKLHLGAFFASQKTQACRGFRRLRSRSAPLQSLAQIPAPQEVDIIPMIDSLATDFRRF
jgi:hypothetical protein